MQPTFWKASLGLVLAMASHAALAASYPDRPVTLVVPYAAGGPVDILSRGLAQSLSEQWGKPVVVENKPGANEIIAAQYVARAPADGYTVLMASDPVLSQNQYLYSKLPYDAENAFEPAVRVARINLAFFVNTKLAPNTVPEFLAYAKANPGQVTYGSSGVGNITHLSMAWLEKTAGVQMTHVPYKGLAPVIQDLLGGQVQASLGAISAIEPHVKAGNIKVLAVSGDTRAKLLPDVPTFKEIGLGDIDANLTVGLLVPKGTPAAVTDVLSQGVRTALKNPAFQQRYIEQVAFEAIGDTPGEFAAYIEQDRPRQQRRIEMSGAKMD